MALPKLRTTAPARSTCCCPLCSATTIGADGVYPCRADVRIEYLVFVDGSFMGARADELAAKREYNAIRRDLLTAPVELAAAEADLDAEYVAEQPTHLAAPMRTAIEVPAGYTAAVIEGVGLPGGPYARLFVATVASATTIWMGQPHTSFQAAHDEIAAYFSPAPLPPHIYPTGDGWTFEGAGRAYNTTTDAAIARSEQATDDEDLPFTPDPTPPALSRRAIPRFPRTAPEVRDQLARRGLIRAAA
jgi:hypothetical protein